MDHVTRFKIGTTYTYHMGERLATVTGRTNGFITYDDHNTRQTYRVKIRTQTVLGSTFEVAFMADQPENLYADKVA